MFNSYLVEFFGTCFLVFIILATGNPVAIACAYALAVILIKVPGLNERRGDIPLLIEHFTQKIAAEQGIAPKSFSDEAIKLLQEYDWTGNIRELRNVVERLVILSGKKIELQDVTNYVLPNQ